MLEDIPKNQDNQTPNLNEISFQNMNHPNVEALLWKDAEFIGVDVKKLKQNSLITITTVSGTVYSIFITDPENALGIIYGGRNFVPPVKIKINGSTKVAEEAQLSRVMVGMSLGLDVKEKTEKAFPFVTTTQIREIKLDDPEQVAIMEVAMQETKQ